MSVSFRHAKRIMLFRALTGFLLVFGLLFLCSGNLHYHQGWYCLITTATLLVNFGLMLRKKPELVKERVSPGPGMKWWDKIFLVLFMLTFLGLVAVAGLDAGRLHWSPALPLFCYSAGYLLLSAAYILTLWSVRTNDYFSAVVRIQKDRNHTVVTCGPYRLIRHPGYTGTIFLAVAIAFILGSLYAVIPAILVAVLFAIRTYLEDLTLQKELPGYAQYAQEVPYRLFPGIW